MFGSSAVTNPFPASMSVSPSHLHQFSPSVQAFPHQLPLRFVARSQRHHRTGFCGSGGSRTRPRCPLWCGGSDIFVSTPLLRRTTTHQQIPRGQEVLAYFSVRGRTLVEDFSRFLLLKDSTSMGSEHFASFPRGQRQTII